jgi:hypothetical protein
MIPAPAFSDSKIEVGKKYCFEVYAADVKGKESLHSTPSDASGQKSRNYLAAILRGDGIHYFDARTKPVRVDALQPLIPIGLD